MQEKIKLSMGKFLILVEVALLFALFSLISTNVLADVDSPNVTVSTLLNIGNVFPEVINVSINDDAGTLTLTPNATTPVYCVAVVRDYNNESDIQNVTATFYDSVVSSSGDTDDNNYHYANSSCALNLSFGSYNGYTDDIYTALANCSFQVEYYANAETWNCNATVYDTYSWSGYAENSIVIQELLALGLPDSIDYGTVNATYVSDENITNVTNFGNVDVNLSLEGYAIAKGDGQAMNCSQGNVGNISIEFEKYNLTASTPGVLSLSAFEASYTNLTTLPAVKTFNLTQRQNDVTNEAVKSSYWRIYVPTGVAGTCTGNIIFGATTAVGT